MISSTARAVLLEGNMKSKRPIDVLRESAGSMDIGSPEEGPIQGYVTFGGRLLIIKEKAVYEHTSADAIDPGHTNAKFPIFSNVYWILDLNRHSWAILC
jgi:hypothetical protein